MDQQEIKDLVETYGTALLREYEAQAAANESVAVAEKIAATTIALGYADGTIDGKNADTRKAQERDILAQSDEYNTAREVTVAANLEAALAEIDRQQLDALLSLTKAWLYSQSGTG